MLEVSGALRFVKGSNAYAAGYDECGNMTSRLVEGKAYLQTYDAENRLISVTQGATTTTMTYDGDGQRVKMSDGTNTTVYIGNWYERTGATVRRGGVTPPLRTGASAWPCATTAPSTGCWATTWGAATSATGRRTG
jgi:YD repeat-containing protein